MYADASKKQNAPDQQMAFCAVRFAYVVGNLRRKLQFVIRDRQQKPRVQIVFYQCYVCEYFKLICLIANAQQNKNIIQTTMATV